MNMTETQSPFLPGTKIQYAWSSIGLELIKTCARKYQYTIIDGWATRNDSIHLRFGLEYHQALQDYAISRAKDIPHEDAIHDTIRALHSRVYAWEVDRTSRAGKYKNRESIVGLVIDYLDHFADDPASTFILDTGEPAVELSFRFELDWGPQYVDQFVPGTAQQPSSAVTSTASSTTSTISTSWTERPPSPPSAPTTWTNGPHRTRCRSTPSPERSC